MASRRTGPGVPFPPPLLFLAGFGLAWWLDTRLEFLIRGGDGASPGQTAIGLAVALAGFVVMLWGIATWGSLLGSGALLARRKLAAKLFLVSTICMVLTHAYNYGIADGLKVMGQGATGVLIFTGVIWLIAFLLLFYSRAMAKRGVLR